MPEQPAFATEGSFVRLALEVDSTADPLAQTDAAGMERIAPPVETPFRTINARVQGPGGWQVTFFEELETQEERLRRQGFTTDHERRR
ncbi:MAG: hypothetical protein WA880_08820 [Ornithinimicrobium sp.]